MIPLWLKVGYTLFLCVIVPAYWRRADAGPLNFLWFSDIALLGTGVTLWLESSLIASTMAVGVLLPELFWNAGFFGRLLTGKRLGSLTDYMFDARGSRVTYVATKPEHNINWVHRWGDTRPQALSGVRYLALLVVAYPLVIFLPTHFLLRLIFAK